MTSGDLITVVLFAVGWASGWVLLWSRRRLPAPPPERPSVAVVIPARNEVANLPVALPHLKALLTPGDQLLVVDDASSDGTAACAQSFDVPVLVLGAPPEGLAGKPRACWEGALATSAELLVFMDADVRLHEGALDALVGALQQAPGALVSVQPWHKPESAVEQLSLIFNAVSMMGSGKFLPGPQRTSLPLAFGPVLAVSRETYTARGGHAAHEVASSLVEDIALARLLGGASVFTGCPRIDFRMYSEGLRSIASNWVRAMSAGARYTPLPLAIGVFLWITALTIPLTGVWWLYPFAALQLLLLSRRLGDFQPWAAVAYPLALAFFLGVAMWSLLVVTTRRSVRWRGRRLRVG